MSNIGSYTNRSFSESQKFLVLDPSTGTTSLVLGSDLVSYIAPQLNAVNAESTRLAAENTNYAVGEVIQTTGATAPGDNLAAVYLVVEGGTGDFPMINGNDLLVIGGDDFLREQLAEDPDIDGNGVLLVNSGMIYRNSIANIESLPATNGLQVSLSGLRSGIFKFNSSNLSTEVTEDAQQGIYIAPSSDPTGASGAWVRQYSGTVNAKWFGAVGDGVTNDTTALQAALDQSKSVFIPSGNYQTTSSLLFESNQEIIGASKGGLAGETKIILTGSSAVFASKTAGVSSTFHPTFKNLTVNNSVVAIGGGGVGSIGIDLQDTSFAAIDQCSFRYHEKAINFLGILAGYYNTVEDCEVSSSTYGIYFDTSGNSNRVLGGRVHSNTTGIFGIASNDMFITCAIESCETGMDLGAGCSGVLFHGRFEGNGRLISDDSIINDITGAACRMRSGSVNNHIFGFCSGATDRIFDEGSNFVHTKSTAYSSVSPYGNENLFLNSSLSFDSDSDGIADGLFLSAAIPAGTTVSLETVDFLTGSASQKLNIDAGGTSRRDLRVQSFKTTIGVQYCFAARVKTNLADGWNFRAGTGFANTDYKNTALNVADSWTTVVVDFIATTTSSSFYFFTNSFTVAGGFGFDPYLLVDSIYFGEGLVPPEFGSDRKRGNSATYDPPSLVDGAGTTTTVNCAGAELGDFTKASFSLDLQGITVTSWVSAADVVSVRFQNETGGTIDLGSGTLSVRVTKS